MTKLNKKIALFMFAIGIGAALPAFADQCLYACSIDYKYCVGSGTSVDECAAQRTECQNICYGVE